MNMPDFETLRWEGGTHGFLSLIDQTCLPTETKRVACKDVETVWEAIKTLRVRGAPAIGIAAAYGVCLGMQPALTVPLSQFQSRLTEVCDYLASSRPTAVNLFWALDRMRACDASSPHLSPADRLSALLEEAKEIHDQDRRTCRAIGMFGAKLLADRSGALTHCNAGGLATAEYGTALSVFFTAQDQGKSVHVFVDETRPLLQGARLTTWELTRRGIDLTLICDSMAAQVMKEGRVQVVITGADRIAANGDSANKIGTYGLAVLAHAHQIPFYIAAPRSTFDFSIATGDQIPIEERHPDEITHGFGKQTAPDGVAVYNPAFDVTPARLIQGIITEHGIIEPVTNARIHEVLSAPNAT